MKKKFIFLLFLLYSLRSGYEEELLSKEAEEKLKSVMIGIYQDSQYFNFFDIVLETLQMGKQISFVHVKNLNEAVIPDIIFCFSFDSIKNKVLWSVYDSVSKTFLKKVEYKIIKNKTMLVKRFAGDIWREIFNEESPFNNEICYLITFYEKNQYGLLDHKTKIIATNPFIKNSQRTILQIKSNILDLSSCFYSIEKTSKLLFSLEMNGKILLMEFLPNGMIKKIFGKNEMIVSPSTENLYKNIFYIKSGFLYYRYYDPIKNIYLEQKLDKDNDYVSVIKIPNENQLIVAKRRSVYLFDYQFSRENELKIVGVTGKKISSKKSKCGGISYNSVRDEIVISEKIGEYYQLVSYQRNGKKKILTTSLSSKHDPSVSLEGNSIVYVSYMGNRGERYLEMFNYYTGDIMRIIEKPGLYRFPVWVMR